MLSSQSRFSESTWSERAIRVALNPQRRYKVVFSMHMKSQQILVTKISENSSEVNKRFLQKTKEKNCSLNNTNFCWPVQLLPGCWQLSAPTCFRSRWSCCCSYRCERSNPSWCRPIHRPTCTRRSGKKQTPSIEHLNKQNMDSNRQNPALIKCATGNSNGLQLLFA